jgi:hypothetical protein
MKTALAMTLVCILVWTAGALISWVWLDAAF